MPVLLIRKNLFHTLCGLLDGLVLPHADNLPAGVSEPPIDPTVAFDVPLELRDPVVRVRPWHVPVLWALMPEAPVNHGDDFVAGEHDVASHPDVTRLDPVVLPKPVTPSVERRPETHLRLRVRPTVALHGRGDSLARRLWVGKALRHHGNLDGSLANSRSEPTLRAMPDLGDQREWERAVTWQDDPPHPASVWELLASNEMPERFRAAVTASAGDRRVLKVGLAHYYEAQGMDPDEVAQAMQGVTGRAHQAQHVRGYLADDGLRKKSMNVRFANLVSGRFTECVFDRAYRSPLEAVGLVVTEGTSARDFLDFTLEKPDEGFGLALNLKNAGVQYRLAQDHVGLAPSDTLPLATYKIFGSADGVAMPLVYVFLVDWDLISKLRNAYWESLNERERDAFRMLASVRGSSEGFGHDLEDAFIEGTIADRLEELLDLVGYDEDSLEELPFRAVSAARCRAIFYMDHRRSPYVYVQRFNTDPNVHVSISQETMHFTDFIDTYLTTQQARSRLLSDLARTRQIDVSDSPV